MTKLTKFLIFLLFVIVLQAGVNNAYALLGSWPPERIAPETKPLGSEEIDKLFEPLGSLKYNYNLRDVVHQALVSDHLTLRAYAATYLGKYGTVDSVAYLIDALSDESGHVGANYLDPAMATTRHRAKLALTELTGEDFGYEWNAPLPKRGLAIEQWIMWFNERNVVIDKVLQYLEENDLGEYDIYRMHLNPDKTEWATSLTLDPPRPGAPGLYINRKTYEIRLLRGR